MGKTCLHRFCGDCKECKEDYEPISSIHPFNNYDCKRYYEIHFIVNEVVERKFIRIFKKEEDEPKVVGID